MVTQNRIIRTRTLADIRLEESARVVEQRKLDILLTIEHRRAGLTLYEDEDFLYLFRNGLRVAIWNSRAVTLVQIRKEADRFLGGDVIDGLIRSGVITIVKEEIL